MPDPFELPRALGSVVPLVFSGDAVVRELVTDRFPTLTTVIRTLHDLAKPAAGLRGVQPVLIDGRTFYMIDLPPGEVRAVDRPLLAFPVRSEHEGPFAGADQNSNCTHDSLLIAGTAEWLAFLPGDAPAIWADLPVDYLTAVRRHEEPAAGALPPARTRLVLIFELLFVVGGIRDRESAGGEQSG